MRLPSRAIAVLLGVAVLGSLSIAQETRASLAGIVSDTSGSLVPEL